MTVILMWLFTIVLANNIILKVIKNPATYAGFLLER